MVNVRNIENVPNVYATAQNICFQILLNVKSAAIAALPKGHQAAEVWFILARHMKDGALRVAGISATA
jgi:hypothetical protein